MVEVKKEPRDEYSDLIKSKLLLDDEEEEEASGGGMEDEQWQQNWSFTQHTT